MNKETEFIQSIREEDIITFNKLINDNIDPSCKDNIGILLSSRNGNFEMVKTLLKNKKVRPQVNNNQPLDYATMFGYYDVFMLLKNDNRTNIYDVNCRATLNAAEYGYFDIFMEIIKNKDINRIHELNTAIRLAFENHHYKIVDFLLDNETFRNNLTKQNNSVFKLILSHYKLKHNVSNF